MLHRTISGNGPACVFVHGWGLSSLVWEPLVRQLRSVLRCQCIDLPGHGGSDAQAGGIEGWADALAEPTNGPALWVGWSLGGLVTLQVALRHPDKVNGMVLVGSTPRFTRAPDWPCAMSGSVLADFSRQLEHDFERTLGRFLALQVFGERSVPAEGRGLLKELRAMLSKAPPSPAGLQQGLDILRETDLRTAVPEIGAPTRVLFGGRDRLSHPDAGAWLANHLPRGQGLRLADAAHAPFLSHTERVADEIRELAGAVP